MKSITNDIIYVGVDDKRLDLFESQYSIKNGMAYNSYVVLDDKITVFDTVDIGYTHEWLDNVEQALEGKSPDYLVIQHMEPDHSANICNFLRVYPQVEVVANAKAFTMIDRFFKPDDTQNRIVVKDGDTLCTGRHAFTFVFAPMVHWPEVMMTYDATDKVFFSADAFGKFGTLDTQEDWAPEAARYYFGIVGKYGMQVQSLLKKVSAFDIQTICPAHGPALTENLGYYLGLYNTWSSYQPEKDGVVIAYTSVYGNTRKAVELFADKLRTSGCPKVIIYDLSRCDKSLAVSDAFRYGKLVLATTTYNADIFPPMREFISDLTERNFQNRTVALIENGSWVPMAAKIMRARLEKCKNLDFADTVVTVNSAVKQDTVSQLSKLAGELCRDYIARSSDTANKNDLSALFNIGYGLYVVTSNNGKRDNGLIVNTITQVTNTPNRVAVTINKNNYSHHIIKQTGVMNVNCLSVDAPFSVFEKFGFKSGRNANKFEGVDFSRSDNGLAFLSSYINSFLSLKVVSYVDLDTHGMFICQITEACVMSDKETMTYTYYQKNVKPQPNTDGVKGYVCKVCGYIYEGDPLPDDFICPICKHGAADFEKIV